MVEEFEELMLLVPAVVALEEKLITVLTVVPVPAVEEEEEEILLATTRVEAAPPSTASVGAVAALSILIKSREPYSLQSENTRSGKLYGPPYYSVMIMGNLIIFMISMNVIK